MGNGAGMLVGAEYVEPADPVVSNLYGSTSGSYPHLDRFNRITTSRWTKETSPGDVDFYDVDVAYDRLGNIERVEDNVYPGRDVAYAYDELNRLLDADEGTWNGSSITSRTRRELWTLDQIGNWDNTKLDLDGDGAYGGTGEWNLSGTFNLVNEQTARGSDTLVYDAVGNLTDNGDDQKYVYDAFGRLVEVKDQSDDLIARYRYNGLSQRIGWQYDVDADGTVETSNSNDDPWFYFIHDDRWRIIGTVVAVDDDPANPSTEAGEWGAGPDDELKEAFVYHAAGANGLGGSSYIDEVILRDRDANTNWEDAGDGTLEERVYYCQNWRADVVHLLDDSGAQVEAIRCSAYGVPFNMLAGDINGDGSVTLADATAHGVADGTSVGDANYTSRADIDLDGDVDTDDYNAGIGSVFGASTGRGVLSPMPDATPDTGNRKGYAGYEWDPVISSSHARGRWSLSNIGRWSQRDPLAYVDGPNLYLYATANPVSGYDPSGTTFIRPWQVPEEPRRLDLQTMARLGCSTFSCQTWGNTFASHVQYSFCSG